MKFFAISVALAFVLSHGGGAMAQKTTTHAIHHYDIDLPAGYSIRDVSPPMMDFSLYEVTGPTPGRLNLYVGNHPSFPAFKWPGAPRIASAGGVTVREYPYSKDERRMEGLFVFDTVTYKTLKYSPWARVHYFASDVSEAEARVLGEIVRSIRVARPHVD